MSWRIEKVPAGWYEVHEYPVSRVGDYESRGLAVIQASELNRERIRRYEADVRYAKARLVGIRREHGRRKGVRVVLLGKDKFVEEWDRPKRRRHESK